MLLNPSRMSRPLRPRLVGGLAALCAAASLCVPAHAQLVITEIMYNPPEGGADSLEFIELYNAGLTDLAVDGYTIAFGGTTDQLRGRLPAGAFYLLAVDSNAFARNYGAVADQQWDGSGLSNGGTTIAITDAAGAPVASVTYDDGGAWPPEPDGDGPSLEICDPAADGNDPANWQASTTAVGVVVNGSELFASPRDLTTCSGGGGNTTVYRPATIVEVTGVDAEGQLDSIGATVQLDVVVTSPSFSAIAQDFYGQDPTGGINIFFDGANYVPMVGDAIRVRGEVQQRNGTARIAAAEIAVSPNAPPPVPAPFVTTSIFEDIQGILVRLEDFRLADPSQWQFDGNFTVDLTNGTDTVAMFVDADTDISGQPAPQGTFDVVGIASQFDRQSPYDEGYQLLPRFLADFDPYVPGSGQVFPYTPLADLQDEDADGVALRTGEKVTVAGIVADFNRNDRGLLFTIVDSSNNGVAIYSPVEDFSYVPVEGDYVNVRGEVTQFRGLTQVEIEDLDFAGAGFPLPDARAVTTLGEDTESRIVEFASVTFPDVSRWRTDSVAFNIDFVTAGGDTLTARFDDNSAFAGTSAPVPGTAYTLRGIGGQFDSSNPFTGGYQLFPRSLADLQLVSGTREVPAEEIMRVLAEAGRLTVTARAELDRLALVDRAGREVISRAGRIAGEFSLDVGALPVGIYYLRAVTRDGRGATVAVPLLR